MTPSSLCWSKGASLSRAESTPAAASSMAARVVGGASCTARSSVSAATRPKRTASSATSAVRDRVDIKAALALMPSVFAGV